MRLDFIFSYWILIWYLAYVVKFTNLSPKFALLIGIIENLALFVFMIYKRTDIDSLLRFGFGNMLIKVLPFYLLRNEIIIRSDVIVTLLVFALYNAWLYINNETFISIVEKTTDSLVHNKNNTPFMKLLDQMEHSLFRLYLIL
jgi:hypothetical protein